MSDKEITVFCVESQRYSPNQITLMESIGAPSNGNGNGNDLQIGSVLEGRYRIDALIGQGGMGAVYRATDQVLERTVAIKLLNNEFINDPEISARFLREARIAAQIDHPNAVVTYDFGLLPEGAAYIIMEFIQGQSLRDLIYHHYPLALTTSLEIMRQTCGAVAAAHQLGIVHRDLKPENIMLKEISQGQIIVKVVDLGLAQFMESNSESYCRLTAQGDILGTPNYMSPEQCTSSRVDELSDIYSLGIVFYEIFCGDTPFQGSFAEVLRKHLFVPVPRMKSAVRLPAMLEELIMQMLRKNKDERPTLARVLFQLDELHRLLNPTTELVRETEIKTLKKIEAMKV